MRRANNTKVWVLTETQIIVDMENDGAKTRFQKNLKGAEIEWKSGRYVVIFYHPTDGTPIYVGLDGTGASLVKDALQAARARREAEFAKEVVTVTPKGGKSTEYEVCGPVPTRALEYELARYGASSIQTSGYCFYRWLDRAKVYEPIANRTLAFAEFKGHAERFLVACREREVDVESVRAERETEWNVFVAGRMVAAVKYNWETRRLHFVGAYPSGKLDSSAHRQAVAGMRNLQMNAGGSEREEWEIELEKRQGLSSGHKLWIRHDARTDNTTPDWLDVCQSRDRKILYVIMDSPNGVI